TVEFFSHISFHQVSSTDILCHMMPFYSYDVPHTCGPDPKICCQFDFKRLPGGRISCPWRVPPEAIHEGNVQHRRVWMLLDQYRKKSKLYRTKVVLAPLGDDFRYHEGSEWDQQFHNYQRLFDYMNSHPELHVKAQFGTLSDYFDALHKAAGLDYPSGKPSFFPILSGDFFTYADRDDHYWSGYFTSRPFYKRLNRVLESNLRAAEILYSMALVHSRQSNIIKVFPSIENYKLLTEARRNLGLFQHHDALTGTSKDWVVVDYGTRLFHSIMNLKRVISDSAHFLILKDKNSYMYNPSTAFLQMDDVQPSQDALPRKTIIKLGMQPRILVIYNPAEQDRATVISVYVNTPKVKIYTATGQPVEAQVSAVWEDATTVSHDAFQVSFLVQLPPLSLGFYHLVELSGTETHLTDYNIYLNGRDGLSMKSSSIFKVEKVQNSAGSISIENPSMNIMFSVSSGLMEKVKTKEDNKVHQVKVEFMWYGTTSNRDKSGAYLFLPDGEAKPYVAVEPPVVRVTHGSIFSEVTSIYHHFTHTLRLYKVQGLDGQSLEISNIVDIRGEFNREIAMRIASDVNSQNRFYTDLNGFQIQPRRTMSKLPLQANFYPLTTMAYIQDDSVRLTLHSAQSLGVASLKSGQLEVIMDRRLMQDDNRGLGQGIQDNKITANLFRVLLERRNGVDEEENTKPISYPSILSHITSLYLNHPLIPMVVNAQHKDTALTAFSPLVSSMPCDMHVVNLRTIQSKVGSGPSDEAALILHRMGFDCRFSNKNIGLFCSTTQGKILVQKMFKDLKVQTLHPVSLTLMHLKQDSSNLDEIQLSSMEISTFRIQLR
uniref:Alpha-mannosidase n=1 Tax=Latimeria chalumnae TaxID=7897 RepID=H3A005_LATCH